MWPSNNRPNYNTVSPERRDSQKGRIWGSRKAQLPSPTVVSPDSATATSSLTDSSHGECLPRCPRALPDDVFSLIGEEAWTPVSSGDPAAEEDDIYSCAARLRAVSPDPTTGKEDAGRPRNTREPERKKASDVGSGEGRTRMERVYVASSLRGKCYHFDHQCRGLRTAGGVSPISIGKATEMDMNPCSVCAVVNHDENKYVPDECVYVAASLRGKCYHSDGKCNGLRSAGGVIPFPIKDATKMNMRPCSICCRPSSTSVRSTGGQPNNSSVAKKFDCNKKNNNYHEINNISCLSSMTSIQDFISMPVSTWLKNLPFLAIYEIWRLYNNKKISKRTLEGELKFFAMNSNGLHLYEVCNNIHKISKTQMIYRQVLKNSKSNNQLHVDQGVGVIPIIIFSARFVIDERKEPALVLSTPRKAPNRRIYRKFGSHRFLDVQVSRDIKDTHLEKLVTMDLWIAERRWSFLWSKKCESPQVYVFFAEEGQGIGCAERISAQDVLNWCIPQTFNPGISVEKLDKRMKLSFSTTIPSGVLPPNSLSKVDDIVADSGDIMTDGCGLISTEALDFIWIHFKRYECFSNMLLYSEDCSDTEECSNKAEVPEEEETAVEAVCPYTSFQGRIGGLKGMWVLDPSLEGLKVKYRSSQEKYKLPQRSLNDSWKSSLYDEFYDTVDVCEFDSNPNKDRVANLNVRAIQVLEYRGVSCDYFQSRVNCGIQEIITVYSGDNNKKLICHLDKQEKRKSNPTFFQMCNAGVEKNEIYFSCMRFNAMKSELKQIQKKARYPVPQCYYFRMVPDHFGVLNEDEVFITSKTSSKFLIAMRFPTYFGNDLIKRKIITLDMIRSRCNDVHLRVLRKTSNEEQFRFYSTLKNCMLLSTKGSRSSADIMSGGDYDGDTAWVCFNEHLVDQVQDCPPAEKICIPGKNAKQLEVAKSGKEGSLQMIKYARHFKYHQGQLGKLSITLDDVMDKFGVGSKEAKIVARYLFLQVDHPYNLQQLTKKEKENILSSSRPHWTDSMWDNDGVKTKFYHSKKTLGRIFDHIESKLPATNSGKRSDVIAQYIKNEEGKYFHVNKLREEMKSAVLRFNKALSVKMTACENDFEEMEEFQAWKEEQLDSWHEALFPNLGDSTDCYLRAAVLYEQSIDCAFQNGREKPYIFAWEVARKHYGAMYILAKSNPRSRYPTSFSIESQDVLLSKKKWRKRRV